MPKYSIKCADGSDRNCSDVEIEIEIKHLTEDQIAEILEKNAIRFSKEEIEYHEIKLTPKQKEELKDSGEVSIDAYARGQTTCPACGSDHSYDKDGNNIDHL